VQSTTAGAATVQVGSPITAKYAELGGSGGPLGTSTTSVICGLRSGGCYQGFAGGTIYWSPGSGAHLITGAPVGRRWSASGREAGPMGFPTTDPVCGLSDGGCFQNFEAASIFSSASGGLHAVWGAIRSWWWAHGSETGTVGYPVTEEICGLRSGGCYQGFTRGTVYWSPATGAHFVAAPIAARWAAQGWEAGPMGYPVTDTTCGLSDGGCFQNFEAASIFSSASGGLHAVWGAIRSWWWAHGSETGTAGYPVTEEICGLRSGGCYQGFTRGTVYWSPASGAHFVAAPVAARWAAQGWEGGPMGYPVSDTTCGLSGGGCYQLFQVGSIYSTASTGARVVWGAILQRWGAQGWETGPAGYPTSDESCDASGCRQQFRGAVITWSPSAGARLATR
jgi:uncharacterized protein with LGFP repeats